MEIGRRFGNHVGDPLDYESPDIRAAHTAGGFTVDDIIPTGVWSGVIKVYVNAKEAGAHYTDPFFFSAVPNQRTFFEMFLASPANVDEDLTDYIAAVPGDKVELSWDRSHLDHHDYLVYHTAGLTNTPDVAVATVGLDDRWTGASGSAQFIWRSAELDPGGHSYQIRPRDIAGNENTGGTLLTATLDPWPQPPTGVEVHAYNMTAGEATIKWNPASDSDASSIYYLYRNAGSDDRVQYGTAVASSSTPFATYGTKYTATVPLGLVGSAAAGTWVVGVRHSNGVVEENNFSALARWVIASDGSYNPGYPRAPGVVAAEAKSAGNVVVTWKHDNQDEPTATSLFNVYRSHSSATSIDYGTVVATASRDVNRYFNGSASFPSLTEGTQFFFAVRSESVGGLESQNTAPTASVTPDATPPTAAAGNEQIDVVIG